MEAIAAEVATAVGAAEDLVAEDQAEAAEASVDLAEAQAAAVAHPAVGETFRNCFA